MTDEVQKETKATNYLYTRFGHSLWSASQLDSASSSKWIVGREQRFYLRCHTLDVEEVEVKMDPLVWVAIEEVMALGVAWIQARVIRRCERAVSCLVAVVYKGTGILRLLPARRYPEI